jgi:endo-1,4-beta-xylanase
MHIDNLNPDIASISANIARFTALGVQVHITELDVSLPTDTNGNVRDNADLTRQADIYRRVAQACFAHPGCTAIQTWGFTDKYSWIRSRTKGAKGAALLFDRNYAPKPAFVAVKEALATRKPTTFSPLHNASDTCSAILRHPASEG